MTTGLGKITDFVRERFNGKKPDKYNEFINQFFTNGLYAMFPQFSFGNFNFNNFRSISN